MSVHVHIFTGDDVLGMSAARERFLQALSEQKEGWEHRAFDDTQHTLDDFLADMQSPTFLDGSRLFHFRHGEQFSPREVRLLGLAMQDLPADTRVLIEYGKVSSKEFLSALNLPKKTYERKNFIKPRDYKMVEWLQGQTDMLWERSIDLDGARLLVEHCDHDLAAIYRELQKIDTYLAPAQPIRLETVQLICGTSVAIKPDDLCDALGFRKWNQVEQVLRHVEDSKGYSLMFFLVSVERHFWNLYKIRAYSETHRDRANLVFRGTFHQKNDAAKEIAFSTGILQPDQEKRLYPAVIKRGIIGQAAKYSLRELRGIQISLAEYDRGCKGGRFRLDLSSFTELCSTIVGMERR
ncbi:DNA polymerase III subunit delta [Chitinivibrio alkaliphilus]|uniref:DNA polymerase III subunit delta n=1 Tax=Chitinivibrio alkaliphilus ACht1 TaxID=1313304 RepID=U7D766_9BACT|nr:DNA polymerase III subunit delta [Chitinivibrio alkaliphilus]ERP31788.1 DNA polymerase III subunit delta [Chitinivibrio alkaliphilus ACht1]